FREKKPAWCYYDNDPKNGAKYGKLYNWYAVNDSRGVCPAGWVVPDRFEHWIKFEQFLDADAGLQLKADSWGHGTDKYGFSALPGGLRLKEGHFLGIDKDARLWTSTPHSQPNATAIMLLSDSPHAIITEDHRGTGMSVRCMKSK